MPSPQNVDKQHEGRVAPKAVDLSSSVRKIKEFIREYCQGREHGSLETDHVAHISQKAF